MTSGWWILTNNQGGVHVHWGRSAVEAKASTRETIAETYAGEGLSATNCKRAAHSYQVRLVAGPLRREDAERARDAWEREDWEAALEHARPHVRAAYGLSPRKGHEDGQHPAARRRTQDRA